MGTTAKTDNHNTTAKLDLRRHFLEKYHKDKPPRVIDACQGSGVMWQQLRREYPLASYWGLDLKPKPGRLKLASERVLQQPGWAADVIDVDTYDSPWKHWLAMLPNVKEPLTVFLTMGMAMTGQSFVGKAELRALGFFALDQRGAPSVNGWPIPATFAAALVKLSVPYMLGSAFNHGLTLDEAIEAVDASPRARYFGLRLRPRK